MLYEEKRRKVTVRWKKFYP